MSGRLEEWSIRIGKVAGAAGRWVDGGWPWLLALAPALLVVLAVVAPLARAASAEFIAGPLYWLGGRICNQTPGHAFIIAGEPFAVCARDFGLLAGAWIGLVLTAARQPAPISGRLFLLALLPVALDGGTQLLGLRESTNILRLLTGLLAGGAALLYLAPRIGRSAPATSCLNPTGNGTGERDRELLSD